MPSRPTVPWRRRALAAVFLAMPFAASAATAACADSPPAAFELSIASGAMRDGKESRIEVRAHADGCVAVHRPWFLRDAGDFELRLDAREWAALQSAVAPQELNKVDRQRLRAQTGNVWKDASADAVVYADPDADLYTLQWRDGDQSRQLVARSPQQAAQRQPKAAEVNRVAEAIGALRALAARPGKRVGAEGTP
ncbi:hypothetical protein [Tahibacter soli]|uniref:Uncharacterized protein n=1 Tax=Tahibacter soli TaxID=2983605 RepID=A0A9X4BJE0_9GAMM|nr:hypothetical protein [Tahibacter soli]MDC8016245.1 hypothetical protein [Tahibacter soli]